MTSVSATQPFPGLRPFETADHPFYFGREEQVGYLRAMLQQRRFVAVVGTSGSGKSSLVKAGLLPLLVSEDPSWKAAEMRPLGRPILELARSFIALTRDLAPERVAGLPDHALEERAEAILQRSSFGLIELVKELQVPARGSPRTSRLDRNEPILLVVDQFEELFRFAEDQNPAEHLLRAGEAQAFVGLLLEASRCEQPAIHVMITMRSDFLGDCARFNGLPEMLTNSQFLVPQLTREQRRAAIEGPIAKAGGMIDPALVQRLLNDGGDEPDQLPVMQHTLMRLWQRASSMTAAQGAAATASGTSSALQPFDPRLTLNDYDSIGGLDQALSRHADEVLSELENSDAGIRLCVKRTFQALTEVDRENRALRRARRLSRLVSITGQPEPAVRRVIERFRQPDCNFIVPPIDMELDAERVIDISHEALIRRWRCLSGGPSQTGWAEEEAEDGRRWNALRENARDYAANPEMLLNPVVTKHAMAWWEQRKPTPQWAELYGGNWEGVRELLDASDQRSKQEQEEQASQERAEAEAKKREQTKSTILRVTVALLGLMTVLFGLYVVLANKVTRAIQVERDLAHAARRQAEEERQVALAAREQLDARVQQLEVSGQSAVKELQDKLDRAERELAVLQRQIPRSSPTSPASEPDASSQTVASVVAQVANPEQVPQPQAITGLAASEGFIWIGGGRPSLLKDNNGNALNSDQIRPNAIYLSNANIVLREGPPNSSEDYASKPSKGIVSAGTPVVALGRPIEYTRPSGSQFWLNVRVPPATADSASIPARLYIHIVDNAQRAVARELELRLEQIKLGNTALIVPGIDLVARQSSANVLRCFSRADCGQDAEALLRSIKSVLAEPEIALQDLSDAYEKSTAIRPRHFELWFGQGNIKLR
ncbi:ATP-binding protein [Microvirga vignae]|uniref:ATP-binding protein n=1 Tax=Microvirga vignae TaxID=1225564 RepID=UPI0006994326|nr:ATP-binding protein [Microvirga vignae]